MAHLLRLPGTRSGARRSSRCRTSARCSTACGVRTSSPNSIGLTAITSCGYGSQPLEDELPVAAGPGVCGPVRVERGAVRYAEGLLAADAGHESGVYCWPRLPGLLADASCRHPRNGSGPGAGFASRRRGAGALMAGPKQAWRSRAVIAVRRVVQAWQVRHVDAVVLDLVQAADTHLVQMPVRLEPRDRLVVRSRVEVGPATHPDGPAVAARLRRRLRPRGVDWRRQLPERLPLRGTRRGRRPLASRLQEASASSPGSRGR